MTIGVDRTMGSTSLTLILLRLLVIVSEAVDRTGVAGGSGGIALSTKTMDFSSKSSLSRMVEGDWKIGGKGFL